MPRYRSLSRAWTILVISTFLVITDRSSGQDRWQLEVKEKQRIEAVLTLEVEAPQVWNGEMLVVAAKAPELSRQRLVATVMKPEAELVVDSSPLNRPILIGRLVGSPTTNKFSWTIKYQATLMSQDLVSVPASARVPAVAPLKLVERKACLRTSPSCDYKAKEVQKWLDEHGLRRKKGERDLDFARRVHLEIGRSFKYKFPTGHDGKAPTVCKVGYGDCGSMTVVFVSVLRAHDIPARAVVGGWVNPTRPEDKKENSAYDYHVMAEFFVDKIGWVPVDPTGNLGKATELRLACFGHDKGDFFTQHLDFDIVATIGGDLRTMSVLQIPGRWYFGRGPWEGIQFRESWVVKPLPPNTKPDVRKKK